MRHFLITFLLLITASIFAIDMIKYPMLTEKKYDLMKEFAYRHYEKSLPILIDPKLVVIHYSSLPSLRYVLDHYRDDSVDPSVEKLAPYGLVNVGTHFVIDYDGTIYELYPTTFMVRHTIGYDHTSISIQNVGSDASYLTEEQLAANAELIKYLMYKHPSISYLIGHMEYMNIRFPHYKLLVESKEDVHTPVKIDPGWNFLNDLRSILKDRYDIELLK